jgi:hypothetical protein
MLAISPSIPSTVPSIVKETASPSDGETISPSSLAIVIAAIGIDTVGILLKKPGGGLTPPSG